QGKQGEASKVVSVLLKDNPRDSEALAMRAILLLQSGGRGQAKNAITELQPLVSKMPFNCALHLNLGRAYMIQGDPESLDQARIHFVEALKIDPWYVPARLALAELLFTRGDNSQAARAADEILKINPANANARLIRAAALMNMREH